MKTKKIIKSAGPKIIKSAGPSSDEIRAVRIASGLDQHEAAILIHASFRAFQDWEYGITRMHPGLWELFLIKTKNL